MSEKTHAAIERNQERMVESVFGQIDQDTQRAPSARVQDLRHARQRCRRHQEMNLLRVIFILLFAFAVSPGSPVFSGKIYKWVDERGVVHFSDQEPDSGKVKGKVEERDLKDPSSVEPPKDTIIKETARNPIEYVTNCTFTIKGPKKDRIRISDFFGGYALTCKHVVDDAPDLTALLNDQQEAQLNVLFTSNKYDLALVQVMVPRKMPYLTIRDAEGLAPGDRLFAVGASAGLQSTVTDGVFTAFRTIDSAERNFHSVLRSLKPGNSGGPLVDENGMVVGVVSLKFLSQQGMPVSGVGFAVPSAQIKEEYGTYTEK